MAPSGTHFLCQSLVESALEAVTAAASLPPLEDHADVRALAGDPDSRGHRSPLAAPSAAGGNEKK
jgi:hypothetical protein